LKDFSSQPEKSLAENVPTGMVCADAGDKMNSNPASASQHFIVFLIYFPVSVVLVFTNRECLTPF